MPKLARLAGLSLAIVGSLATGGCVSTAEPYPVTDNGPNPAPLPGYRVHCQSFAAPVPPWMRVYTSACQQEFVPTGPVIRARG